MTDAVTTEPQSAEPGGPESERATSEATESAADTDPAEVQPGRGAGLRWVVLAALAVALAAGIVLVASNSDDGPPIVEVTVPPGTGSRLDAGEVVEVVADVLRVEPGGSIELVNGDERLHVLGSLRADAGETVRLAFATEGRYRLPTSLRSDGQVTVLVEDPDRTEN